MPSVPLCFSIVRPNGQICGGELLSVIMTNSPNFISGSFFVHLVRVCTWFKYSAFQLVQNFWLSFLTNCHLLVLLMQYLKNAQVGTDESIRIGCYCSKLKPTAFFKRPPTLNTPSLSEKKHIIVPFHLKISHYFRFSILSIRRKKVIL